MSEVFWNFISVVGTIGSFIMFVEWMLCSLIKLHWPRQMK